MNRICLATLLLATALFSSATHAQFPPAPGTGPGLPETIEAIDAARVTTRILYITAHPDDESAAALTYLARGLHADVALLSLTRGEGGQNALGPEQAPQLGLIRTQELLAATRGYGVKLYFTRAKDFGFSKTPEETEKIWGDPVMEDMVRVIREFRPNIVINGWGGVHTGHGHHQTSGLWTPKAVKLAADAKYLADANFPAWNNNGAGVQILDVERGTDNPKGYILPVDEVSPLYGKSYREIGIDAFSNHRSQGISAFLSSPFLRRPLALIPEDGSKLDPATLNQNLVAFAQSIGCDKNPKLCENLKLADVKLSEARQAALELNWIKASKSLKQAQADLTELLPGDIRPPKLKLPERFQTSLQDIRSHVVTAQGLVDGLQVDAIADKPDIVLGESFGVRITQRCRSGIECPRVGFLLVPKGIRIQQKEASDTVQDYSVEVQSSSADPSLLERLLPESRPLLEVMQGVGGNVTAGTEIYRPFPVTSIATTSTQVSRVPLRIVPAYTIAVEPTQSHRSSLCHAQTLRRIFCASTPIPRNPPRFPSASTLPTDSPPAASSNSRSTASATNTPNSPSPHPPSLRPATSPSPPTLSAATKNSPPRLNHFPPCPPFSGASLRKPSSTPSTSTFPPISASATSPPKANRFRTPSTVSASTSKCSTPTLSPSATSRNTLPSSSVSAPTNSAPNSRAPTSACSTTSRTAARSSSSTIATSSGTKFLPAPYHATIGNPTPRITDENAEVKFLKPDDPLLNGPTKSPPTISRTGSRNAASTTGATSIRKYTPLLSMHDPGESDLNGGLVYTHLGKGVYIYTGLAFFRELPEGVPGAYRLFVNLLSASQSAR